MTVESRGLQAVLSFFAGLLLVLLSLLALTGTVIPFIRNALLAFAAILTIGAIQYVLWDRSAQHSQMPDDDDNDTSIP